MEEGPPRRWADRPGEESAPKGWQCPEVTVSGAPSAPVTTAQRLGERQLFLALHPAPLRPPSELLDQGA